MLIYKIDVLDTLKESGYNSTRILKENLISQSAMQKIRKKEKEGKKNKEIAEMLQISTETIKTQKIRAINRLKKYSGILFSFLFSVYR